MRRNWTEIGGQTGYYIRAFFYIFMLQGLFSLIVNGPAFFITIYTSTKPLVWLDYLGAAVWLIGFLIELIADAQLKMHIADRTPGKKKFIRWGLWRYSRHPNYFGEAMLWWGIYLIGCSLSYGWAFFLCPLFIGLLVRFVSGVPLLEAKYEKNPEFREYCRETNVFFPWFVKHQNEPLHL